MVWKLLQLLIALGVLLIGLLLVWDALQRKPVPAAFSRVGGPTRVETAVEAARFWLPQPQRVVKTDASASAAIIWKAARCAISHDAPLLFTASDPARRRLVDQTIRTWRKNAKPSGQTRLEVIEVRSPADMPSCRTNKEYLSNTKGLSTPKSFKWHLGTLTIDAKKKLAPVVVFAAAKELADPPDVAVASALAAHLATTDREISLVVVPRYLQADPELEKTLRERREVVASGVVLGQTGILSEDMRALLRQLLASTGRSGFLGELRSTLGSLDALIAALLALLGAWAVSQAAPELARAAPQLAGQVVGTPPGEWRTRSMAAARTMRSRFTGRKAPPTTSSILDDLMVVLAGQEANRRVTVWLHSGWKVTGTLDRGREEVDTQAAASLRLKDAELVRDEREPTTTPRTSEGGKRSENMGTVLVPVDVIQLVSVKVQESSS